MKKLIFTLILVFGTLLCQAGITSEKNQVKQKDTLHFIVHGLNNSEANFKKFKEKYGVGIITENCVVDPVSYRKTIEHNQHVVEYLNREYGNTWRKDLPIKPFGVK